MNNKLNAIDRSLRTAAEKVGLKVYFYKEASALYREASIQDAEYDRVMRLSYTDNKVCLEGEINFDSISSVQLAEIFNALLIENELQLVRE